MRCIVFSFCALMTATAALAQVPGTPPTAVKEFGPPKVSEPWERVVFTEAVPHSDIPADITLLETVDGLFTPIVDCLISVRVRELHVALHIPIDVTRGRQRILQDSRVWLPCGRLFQIDPIEWHAQFQRAADRFDNGIGG